jgi:hypothetical protein
MTLFLKNTFIKFIVVVILLIILYSSASAEKSFHSGYGTEDEPYLIQTAEQLNSVRYFLDKYFKLISDIDLSKYSAEYGWIPIGTESNKFKGTFDGNGYKIENLSTSFPDSPCVGLFGYAGRGSVIKNINLKSVNVLGNEYVGGLAGYNEGNLFNNYIYNGEIKGNENVGGLVGYNAGTIENSHVIINISGNENIGGLVGGNNSKDIINSSAAGKVTGSGLFNTKIGGLVGQIIGGNITKSYSTCKVEGSRDVGGLVGRSGGFYASGVGDILESYATGDVKGRSNIGGLVGCKWGGNILNAYAIGNVSGRKKVGGLIGSCDFYGSRIVNSYSKGEVKGGQPVGGLIGSFDGSIENSFYDKITSKRVDIGKGVFLETSKMLKRETYEPEWDFENIWKIIEGESYPYFQWQDNNIPYSLN